jgi:hypothetical protein
MDSRTLLAAVDDAFVTTGASTPPWPDPHEGMDGPRDEEYSRCLDPGKYRILDARAQAWVSALTRLGLAAVEEVEEPDRAWRDRPPRAELDRAIWLRPARDGAVRLLLGFSGTPDGAETIYVGAGEPAVLALLTPGCGCDACDDGSERLLDELDEHVMAIVSGDFVHLARGENTVMSTGRGWTASGKFTDRRRDIEALLADARAGRSTYPVVMGVSWW